MRELGYIRTYLKKGKNRIRFSIQKSIIIKTIGLIPTAFLTLVRTTLNQGDEYKRKRVKNFLDLK